MATSDENIHRTAYLWMRAHGDKALERARGVLESSRGDGEQEETWLRVIATILALGGVVPPDLH